MDFSAGYNDQKHMANLVKEWYREKEVSIVSWPSQSPFLNPIENLSNELKRKLGCQYFPNWNRLWDAVQTEWYSIPQETCQKFVGSIPR